MGYGTRAIQLLVDYYSGTMNTTPPSHESTSSHGNSTCDEVDYESGGLLEEVIGPRRSLPPLLTDLQERHPEALDYVGVAFGLTPQLLKYAVVHMWQII